MRRLHSNSFADLVRAVGHLNVDDPAIQRRIATMLGLKVKPSERQQQERRFRPTARPTPTPPALRREEHAEKDGSQVRPEIRRRERFEPKPFLDSHDDAWLEPLVVQHLELPDWFEHVVALPSEDPAREYEMPPIDPLLEPAWKRAILHTALATTSASGAPDVEALVNILARAQPLTRLPRLPRKHLQNGVQVLWDLNPSMQPYAEDQGQVVQDIRRLVSPDLIDEFVFLVCPTRGVGREELWPRRAYQPPRRSTPVLLLTDLGVGPVGPRAQPAGPQEWKAFARIVRRAGCPLLALVPYPLIPRTLRTAMTVIAWDRTTTTGQVGALRAASERKRQP